MPPRVARQSNSSPPEKKTGGNVLDRIAPLGFADDEGIKINLYGRSGTGKTTLSATFPKPLLMVVCSGGGELRSIDTPEYRKTIRQVTLEKSSEIEDLAEHAPGKFKTIVLDHATGFQDLILKEVLGLDHVPPQLSWGVASQQQYGQVALQVKTYLRRLLDLPLNVVIIAQEREFNVDQDNEVLTPYVASALTPSVVGWLLPACDYVCQTFIRSKMETKTVRVGEKSVTQQIKTPVKEYCLRTSPSEVYASKFRVPKGSELPDVLVDPSYRKIMQLIRKVK